MARVVVAGGVVMDFVFQVPSWPNQGEAVQGSFHDAPGGKGLNQSVGCARLGADTSVISAIGDDPYGKRLRTILEAENVTLHVDTVEERIGSDVTAVILSENGQAGFIGCRRATERLTPAFVEAAKGAISKADVALVTFDASVEAAQKVVELAKLERKKIIINPAPPMEVPLSIVAGVEYVVPNEWEARSWLELVGECSSEQLRSMSNEDVGRRILDHGAKAVIITLGVEGCMVIDRTGVRRYRAFRVDALDTTGASDSFCAGLAVAVAAGKRHRDRIYFASAAGSLACTRLGAYRSMPHLDEVERFVKQRASERLEERVPRLAYENSETPEVTAEEAEASD